RRPAPRAPPAPSGPRRLPAHIPRGACDDREEPRPRRRGPSLPGRPGARGRSLRAGASPQGPPRPRRLRLQQSEERVHPNHEDQRPMNNNEYLQAVLREQTLAPESDELKALQKQREKVEKLLRDHFADCSPTIRYGGSKAKGTMIKAAYDLDVICYFPHDDTAAGETLEDIYENTRKALEAD